MPVFFCTLNYVLPPRSLLAVSYDLEGVSRTGHSQTVQTANLCVNVAPRTRVWSASVIDVREIVYGAGMRSPGFKSECMALLVTAFHSPIVFYYLFVKPFSLILSIPVSLFVEKMGRTDM